MADNTHNPLLIVGSIAILAIAWLIIIAYWFVSPFIPVHLSDDQKTAVWEAIYG